MLTREQRACEVRLDDLTQPGKVFLVGRATPFNTRSANLGTNSDRWYEMSVPGAADEALAASGNIPHLLNHERNRFLGDTAAGTTRVWADTRALRYKTELAVDTPEAKTVMAHFKRGEVRSSSFAFDIDPDNPDAQGWEKITDDDGEPAYLRTIYKFNRLYDVSTLVGAEPAYSSGTSATMSDRALPIGMPVELRARLEQRAAPNTDPSDIDDDDDDDLCLCECDRCAENRCEECEDPACEDSACDDQGCPMQDGDRSAPERDELAMIDVDLEIEEASLGR